MAEQEQVNIGIGFEALPEGVHGLEQAKHHAHELGEHLEHVKEAAHEVKDHLREVATTLAAGAGIGFGLEGMYRLFVESNMELEKMTRQQGSMIAGAYQFGHLGPYDNLVHSLKVANEQMEEFAQKSMKTGISKEAYGAAFQVLIPAMSQAHKSVAETASLTERAAILARSMGMDPASAAQSIALAVETGTVRRNQFLMALGIHGQRGENQEHLLSRIQSAITAFPIENLSQMRTLSDTFGVIRAQVAEIGEMAGKPLFDEVTRGAAEFAHWMSENRGDVEKIAHTVGGALVEALRDAAGVLKFMAEHAQAVKVAAEGIALAWGTKKLYGGLNAGLGVAEKAATAMGAESIGAAIMAINPITAAIIATGAAATLLSYAMNADVGHKSTEEKVADAHEQARKTEHDARQAAISEFFTGMTPEKAKSTYTAFMGSDLMKSGGFSLGGKHVGMGDLGEYARAHGLEVVKAMKEEELKEHSKLSGNVNMNVTNNWNFDKNHDADEIAFSVADIFRQMANNPRTTKNIVSTVHRGTV